MAKHRQQVRIEVEGAAAERRIREVARQARRFSIPWIRDRFADALTFPRGERPPTRMIRVLKMAPNASALPRPRVIDSEGFP
ncbi:hypothetical protein [Frankia tisae]|uniref:hypothetical protein n=1 Tax=Frankia tisae TaxID=2950104 RepID=UPI0021BEFDF0|nr:hypothetical protein [Frankia tisae]